jgi:hypothetical protein
MKIQNLEHLENHTSIFNNSVNMQIQIENSTLREGKKKRQHMKFKTTLEIVQSQIGKFKTLRKRKPNLKKMQI